MRERLKEIAVKTVYAVVLSAPVFSSGCNNLENPHVVTAELKQGREAQATAILNDTAKAYPPLIKSDVVVYLIPPIVTGEIIQIDIIVIDKTTGLENPSTHSKTFKYTDYYEKDGLYKVNWPNLEQDLRAYLNSEFK